MVERCPTMSCASSPQRASSATRRSSPRRCSGCSRTIGSGHWPSSSARSGFTSAASTNSRRRTRSCSRRSTPSCGKAIYEESILFFQDLFQSDRAVTEILDADYTFLNETLAKHYGIPGVTGPQWRRVEGVRKYGRGGVLGLASVQAKQAGASRTSPVLRGNWVVETLLGEKLPRPPADVPRLPEEEGGRRPDHAAAGREARAGPRPAPSAMTGSTRSGSPWRSTTPSAGCGHGTSAGWRSMHGRSSGTAPSSRASTACGPTC